MKGVTDVGVRALSANCPRLSHLNLSGMYLLTDGKQRDFGLEGLQALCGHGRNVTFLHLVGCFQGFLGRTEGRRIARPSLARCVDRPLNSRQIDSRLDE